MSVRLTKVRRAYLSPSFFVEEEMFTPPIGYTITADGEERFWLYTHTFIDDRVGTCWVDDWNEFLYLYESLGCRIKVYVEKLKVFMLAQKVG